MEHDVEKLIRDKVHAAEHKNMRWQKADVWSKINGELTPIRKSYFWYYAAASFLVAIGLCLYSLQLLNQNKSNPKTDQLSIVTNRPNIKVSTPQQAEPQETCESDNTCFKEAEKIVLPKIKSKGVIQLAYVPLKQEEAPLVLKEEKLQVTELTSNEAFVEKPYQVEPIIGVVIPEKPNLAIVKQKKVKFRVLRSSESEFAKRYKESKIILARVH